MRSLFVSPRKAILFAAAKSVAYREPLGLLWVMINIGLLRQVQVIILLKIVEASSFGGEGIIVNRRRRHATVACGKSVDRRRRMNN